MFLKRLPAIAFVLMGGLLQGTALAQTDSSYFTNFAKAENRVRFYKNVVNNTIGKKLSKPLSAETAEDWAEAFAAIELLHYQQPWLRNSMQTGADSLLRMDAEFQRSWLELVYNRSEKGFEEPVRRLMEQTPDISILAFCCEYLLQQDTSASNKRRLYDWVIQQANRFGTFSEKAVLHALMNRLNSSTATLTREKLLAFAQPDYLPKQVLVLSCQRKNRNYPGLVLIRDTAGHWLKDSTGTLFTLPQLARSLGNMPGYLRNGNTPQGLFRMKGMANSRSFFIGPSPNIQLMLPVESSVQHFLQDSTILDSIFTRNHYAQLLPETLRNDESLYESYDAGAAGRTEIIAHGTAVDPTFYVGQPYYPFTPTAGCLATVEWWNDNGYRRYSDQQVLANAIRKAGGANGYLLVLELDDKQAPVTEKDLLEYAPQLAK